MERVWEVRECDPDRSQALAGALDVPLLLACLLLQREVHNAEQARRFLTPSLAELDDPSSMKGMDTAVARLEEAIKRGEKVCIYGDYDVDGVTSVSVLMLFLRRVGLQVDYFIPSRLVEGYGLNAASIEEIAARGATLLVTVDCGISDLDQVEVARRAGMDVIIIDHHQVPDELPAAVTILNPHQPGCAFPTKDLAAVGVVFNLVIALRADLRDKGMFKRGEEPNLRAYLDLVSLGTVADIVPLLQENRIITRFGLEELTAGRRPGVAALKEVAGMLSDDVAVGQVAFRLAPRINAVGRLGKASRAVELLTTRSYSEALTIARELDQANSERQGIEQAMFDEAIRHAERRRERGETGALVLASDTWHVGVVGIVASRLVERYGCPVILIAIDGEEGRGSARGTEHVHLYRALSESADTLQSYGGHRAAAGLSIRRDQIEAFRGSFIEAVQRQTRDVQLVHKHKVDARVQPAELTPALVEQLGRLAPHGLGNPEPLFVAENLPLRAARLVGREAPGHLKALVIDGERSWDVIGFGMGDRLGDATERVDIVYTPEFNTWDGTTSIQLRLRDLRPAQPE